MQKKLVTTVVIVSMFSLFGCQSNKAPSNVFRPFISAETQSINLSQAVQEALMRQGDPAIANVRVQVRQDTAILSGYVKKIRQSDVAEQITRQVPGVRSVENNIIIRP